jgi:hypothetical protein
MNRIVNIKVNPKDVRYDKYPIPSRNAYTGNTIWTPPEGTDRQISPLFAA